MGRGLKYDIPGDDWRCGMDEVAAQGWEAIFTPDLEAPLQLVVEIGFGEERRNRVFKEHARRDGFSREGGHHGSALAWPASNRRDA